MQPGCDLVGLTLEKASHLGVGCRIAQFSGPAFHCDCFSPAVEHNDPVSYRVNARQVMRDDDKGYPKMIRQLGNQKIQVRRRYWIQAG